MTKSIQFQDLKRTTLDPRIISGYRILEESPRNNISKWFEIEIIIGKIQVKMIRLQYEIEEATLKDMAIETGRPSAGYIIPNYRWSKENYDKTKEIFLDDVQQLEMLILHQTLPTYNVEKND